MCGLEATPAAPQGHRTRDLIARNPPQGIIDTQHARLTRVGMTNSRSDQPLMRQGDFIGFRLALQETTKKMHLLIENPLSASHLSVGQQAALGPVGRTAPRSIKAEFQASRTSRQSIGLKPIAMKLRSHAIQEPRNRERLSRLEVGKEIAVQTWLLVKEPWENPRNRPQSATFPPIGFQG